jgi:hypothetical protein
MSPRDPVRRLSRLSPGARSELFRLLSATDDARADAIRQLYRRPQTEDLAEVLIDVEADPALRLELLRVLRDSLPWANP